MPLFAGLVSAVFFHLFAFFSARLSLGVALGLAFGAASLMAIAALKLALGAIWAAIPVVLPEMVATGLGWIMPSNLTACLASLIMIDVIAAAYRYWRDTAGLVAGVVAR